MQQAELVADIAMNTATGSDESTFKDIDVIDQNNNDITDATETVSKKRRRWRNGTVVKRDIKRLSKSTKLLFAKRPFQRLVVEISQNTIVGLSFQKKCMESIQESSEAYILDILKDADECRKHARRTTMTEEDLKLAIRMRRP